MSTTSHSKPSQSNIFSGVVSDTLPNTKFRIMLDNGHEVLAYLGGKMKHHRIRVVVGDKVQVMIDRYGGAHRIVRRG